MLRVEEVRDLPGLPALREEWRALLRRAGGGSLFQTYEWIVSWLETFWRDRPIRFLVVRDGTRLRGVAPLLVDAAGELWCPGSLALPVNPHARKADFVYEGDPQTFCAAVVGHLENDAEPARVALGQIESGSPTVAALDEVGASRGFTTVLMPGRPSPVVRLDGDWEGYVASRTTRLRRELRRKRRKIERSGELSITVEGEAARCERAMDEVMAIERRSWKEQAGTSFSAESGLERFYRTLAVRGAARGWWRLYLLHLDRRPVAHIYGFVHANRYYALKTSFDEAYRPLSPGAVLFAHALRDAHADGLRAFDLLGDDSRWKRELANDASQHLAVCAVPDSVLRCRVCKVYQSRIKPFIKRRLPLVAAAGRRMSARAG